VKALISSVDWHYSPFVSIHQKIDGFSIYEIIAHTMLSIR